MSSSHPDPITKNIDLRRGAKKRWPSKTYIFNTALGIASDIDNPKDKVNFTTLIKEGRGSGFRDSAKTATQQLSFDLGGVRFPNDPPKP